MLNCDAASVIFTPARCVLRCCRCLKRVNVLFLLIPVHSLRSFRMQSAFSYAPLQIFTLGILQHSFFSPNSLWNWASVYQSETIYWYFVRLEFCFFFFPPPRLQMNGPVMFCVVFPKCLSISSGYERKPLSSSSSSFYYYVSHGRPARLCHFMLFFKHTHTHTQKNSASFQLLLSSMLRAKKKKDTSVWSLFFIFFL